MARVESSHRPLRADAERNRRRLLDAARATLAEQGIGAGVDAIADAAGVGVGTLYRRFPTKEHLLRAILEDRIDAFTERLGELAELEDPWNAFVAATEIFAGAIAEDRALFQILQQAQSQPLVGEDARARMLDAFAPFLMRAQAAGVVRQDIVVRDVPALCAVAARLPAWRLKREPELWRRYLAIILDGLRPEGAHALPHPAPSPIAGDAGRLPADDSVHGGAAGETRRGGGTDE